MTFATLFPPGEILWLVKPNDLILPGDVPGEEQTDLRLFKVSRLAGPLSRVADDRPMAGDGTRRRCVQANALHIQVRRAIC